MTEDYCAVLPYYNPTNPSCPWQGPQNSGEQTNFSLLRGQDLDDVGLLYGVFRYAGQSSKYIENDDHFRDRLIEIHKRGNARQNYHFNIDVQAILEARFVVKKSFIQKFMELFS